MDDIFNDDLPEEVEITENVEDFRDVIQLTQYDGGLDSNDPNQFGVIAEYDTIDLKGLKVKCEKQAKNFTGLVEKLVTSFNDVELNEDHLSYLKEVSRLQMSNLSDLLHMVAINKQMIENITNRVNAVMGEDYALIHAYNALVSQHIKLIKELEIHYKNIPSALKKMRAEVLCDQELLDVPPSSMNVVTDDYGKTQFNSHKDMLKAILGVSQGNT